MESDNPTTHTMNLAIYSYGWEAFRFPYPAGWTLVGAGDVDDAGTPQQIWFNASTSQLSFWTIKCSGGLLFGRLNDLDCTQAVDRTVPAPAGFTPHLADLNGDGVIDIVWTSASRAVKYWVNTGKDRFTKTDAPDASPNGFDLIGAGEIAGTGRTDLIWFNAATGNIGWWLMDGTTVTGRKTTAGPAGYSVATIEDFDGDGLADVFWTNAKGTAYVWQGTGGGFISQQVADGAGTPYVVPTGYKVQMNRLQGVANPTAAHAARAQIAAVSH